MFISIVFLVLVGVGMYLSFMYAIAPPERPYYVSPLDWRSRNSDLSLNYAVLSVLVGIVGTMWFIATL